MNVGPMDLLPVAAFLAGTVALVAAALEVGGRREAARVHRGALWTASALTGAAFLYLVSRFVVLDLSYTYVWLYTGTGVPLQYRIAGAWSGREGSLLLWALCMVAVASLFASAHLRRGAADGEEARARAWSRLFLTGLAVAFLWAVVRPLLAAPPDPQGYVFHATPRFLLQGQPGGNGLNPLLLNPYILIHPPLMFAAYALAAVPAAAALGHLATGTNRWSRVAFAWARTDWLLYTLAMGLGALWAYYTLGFGGYWAWDPVEVANLLPWLALTAYLHAQAHHRRHGTYATIGPFLALLPWVLTLFSTISTRSGLWVSVHAFTDPTATFDPDPFARFQDILHAEPGLSFHAGLMAAVLLGGLALWARRLAAQHGTLDRTSRAVAGLLAALATGFLLAPATTLGLLFEAGHTLAFGNTGFGLLALGVGAVLGAAAPALAAEGKTGADHAAAAEPANPARRNTQGPLARLNMRTLAYASVVTLSLLLLVLVLFHLHAVQGWSPAFYEAWVPFLATPVLLGFILLLAHGAYGRSAAVWTAGAAWFAALAAALLVPAHRTTEPLHTFVLGPLDLAVVPQRAGAYLAVLALAATVVGLDRARIAARNPAWNRRGAAGAGLLCLASLLNIIFWLNPPSRIILGPWTWHPVWPVQLFLGSAAFLGLLLSLLLLSGAPVRPRGATALLVGILGAYYVAPILALAGGWMMRAAPGPAARPATVRHRLRTAGLYGIHAVLALLVLGYATSTYLGEEDTITLEPGQSAAIGGLHLTHTATRSDMEAGTPWAASLHPQLELQQRGASRGTSEAILYWEAQTGSHYPLPATHRLWDRELHWNVERLCIDPASACERGRDWVNAYDGTSSRVTADATITRVELNVATLPGLGLVWAGLFLLLFAMLLVVQGTRAAPPPTGPPAPPATGGGTDARATTLKASAASPGAVEREAQGPEDASPDDGAPPRRQATGHASAGARRAGLAATLLVALLAWTPGAAAHDQDAAPLLRDDVERVWHEPEHVVAGEQFQGFIRFAEDSPVQAVGYQVCIMQQIVCIIAPRPATLLEDNQTWSFDTTDFVNPQTGRNYPWPEGRIGVQYFLAEHALADADNLSDEDWEAMIKFPEGPELGSEECSGRLIQCYEESYFVFHVDAQGEPRGAPAPGAVALLAILALAGTARAHPRCSGRVSRAPG